LLEKEKYALRGNLRLTLLCTFRQ